MLKYSEWTYRRKIVLTDLERVLKKINMLANSGNFENVENSQEILAAIYNNIEIQKRSLEFNDLLWNEAFLN